MKINVISLGCPKNLVDTELMLGQLVKSGYKITTTPKNADILLINTCAFIKPAREEAYAAIIDGVFWKRKKKGRLLIVAGCLPNLEKHRVLESFPEVDGIIGSGSIEKIAELIKNLKSIKHPAYLKGKATLPGEHSQRIITTSPYATYVKIAEGCSNCCSYCTVPLIKGKFKSRPMPLVIKEVESLVKLGIKEINLIAQDTTNYGMDLYHKRKLPELLQKLCRIPGDFWIRLLYTYPSHINSNLIKVIAAEPKICKYLDLPIQHSSNSILKAMHRRYTERDLEKLICTLRQKIPGIVIRTSLIAGFPGERAEDFQSLRRFVNKIKFERLGAFIYSAEDKTKAAKLKKQISENEKEKRLDSIMKLQQLISKKIQRSLVGKNLKVLVLNPKWGRSYRDAPDIDGVVYLKNLPINSLGKFVQVKITKALAYDLEGKVISHL